MTNQELRNRNLRLNDILLSNNIHTIHVVHWPVIFNAVCVCTVCLLSQLINNNILLLLFLYLRIISIR